MADDKPDETLFDRALRHANEAWLVEQQNFDDGRDDQRFAAGDQWDDKARQDREAANRPVITVNRIKTFVRQVTGDVRRDTPAIKVLPARGKASEDMASIYNGLIRNIEQQSNAKAAYVTGTEGACITGLGNIKVVTEYSGNDGFEQDIRIRRIRDHFAVLWDPAAKEPDKSDARYLFELEQIPTEEFKRRFPDAVPDNFPVAPAVTSPGNFTWYTENSVTVAHYWWKETKKKLVLLLADGRVIDSDTALAETKTGVVLEVKEKREVSEDEVWQVMLAGHAELSKPGKWAGRHIPYAPVIGEEEIIEGRLVRKGMVRDMKDPQRVYNYMRTAAVEAAALQPKMPWLVPIDSIKGLEDAWSKAGTQNLPFLPYHPIPSQPGLAPRRAEPALAQTGLDSQSMIAADELKAVPGIYDASLGARSNETSGRAILARQREGETGTYHYIDNLATAIRRIGVILVDLIPKIYDTERTVRVLAEDGSQQMVEVNKENPISLAMEKMNDLGAGEYDVVVVTGPSFATRRQEATEGMRELVQAFPPLMAKAGHIIIKNMDFPGADEVAKLLEPPEGPPQPPPDLLAKVAKDEAAARKTTAEAEGQEIKNMADFTQLQMAMGALGQQMMAMQQALATFQQMAMQPPAPPGPPPGMMPPDGMPPGMAPPGLPEPPMPPTNLDDLRPLRTISTPAGEVMVSEA